MQKTLEVKGMVCPFPLIEAQNTKDMQVGSLIGQDFYVKII